MTGPVVIIMEDVQNALPIIQQCVPNHFVLLEARITAATPKQDATITEEFDHANNQKGLDVFKPYKHLNSQINNKSYSNDCGRKCCVTLIHLYQI